MERKGELLLVTANICGYQQRSLEVVASSGTW